MWWAWIAGAIAGDDPRVLLGRGHAALESGRGDEALALAVEAWEASPTAEAHRLYLDALAEAGLTLWTEEVAGADVQTPPWVVEAMGVVELAGTDDKAAAAEAAAVLARWPDHPEAFLPLWEIEDPGKRVARFRRKVATAASLPEPESATAPALYGARTLVQGIGEDDTEVTEALRALGEPIPDFPAPSTRHERSELARKLAMSPFAGLPRVHPGDLYDVVHRACANWEQGGDHDSALAAWVAFREASRDPRGAVGHAEALVHASRPADALAVADQALLAVAGPWPDDVGALRFEARRELLAEAFVVRARCQAEREPGLALVDLTLADHLGRRVMDAALGERLHDRSRALAEQTRRQYQGRATPLEVAMVRTEKAIDEKRPEEAIKLAADALFVAASSAQGPSAQSAIALMAELVWIERARAKAWEALGRREEATVATAVAHHLGQGSDTGLWELRARQLEDASARVAAFNHWAVVARNADSDAMKQEAAAGLQRTWSGVGPWEATARRVGLEAVPPAPLYRLDIALQTVERGVVKAVGAGAAAAGGSGPPQEGAPMPPWSVTSDRGGTVTSESMRGRVVVLMFFGADCADCLGLLHDVGTVARSLRRENRDIVVVAVSWDEDPGDFEDARRVADSWGTLYRDPELARRFGVSNRPTAWVVDAQGTTRAQIDRWVSVAYVERQLRRVFAE